MPFKDLNLNRELVEEYIREASENGTLVDSEQKTETQFNHYFVIDGERCLLIIYYKKTSGTTTLNFKSGQNPELSRAIASEIADRAMMGEIECGSITFRNVQEDEFNYLSEFITEEIQGVEVKNLNDSQSETQLEISGIFNDKVSLKYYKTTGTVLLQGRPLPIFQHVKLFFYALVPEEKIVESENKAYNINLTVAECRETLQQFLPTSYAFLDKKVKKILTPALTLNNINIDLEDYSLFCFPILRGIEGYMRKILAERGGQYKNTRNIGSLFDDNVEPSALSNHVAQEIQCDKTIEALEKSYNFWHSKRHPYFHVNHKHVEVTPIIEKKEAAQALIVEGLDLIESTYCQIP